MPTKRDVVYMVLEGKGSSYVPWSFGFTQKPAALLQDYYGTEDLDAASGNHILRLGNDVGFFEDLGNNRFQDVFGVVWDRSINKDIGNVETPLLAEPTLSDYQFPDPLDERFFTDIEEKLAAKPDLFRQFQIGFSLYERAWCLRGMENLLMDFLLNPEFVHELLVAIVNCNIAQVRRALEYDIDGVYFGDDWGQQNGLIIGPHLWREFIFPQLQRMYKVVKDAGKYVMIHACGKVDELFDDLIEAGLDCFNPFQPEAMDVQALMSKYRDRLDFHGGLSMQKTLPYGTPENVRQESLAFIEVAQQQDGYR